MGDIQQGRGRGVASVRGRRRGRARLTAIQNSGSSLVDLQGSGQIADIQNRGRGKNRGRGRARLTTVQNSGQSLVDLQGSGQIADIQNRGRGKNRGRGRARLTTVQSSGSRGHQVANGSTGDDQFIQATSTNLPKINFMKVAEYFQRLRSPELRQAKDVVSAHANYGDNAVGYVKVRVNGTNAMVEARLTPQTSVNKTPYFVCVALNEITKTILSAQCNCQASMGGCKHQTALIFWLLRRSEEPSPTEVACYWKKSVLSTIKEKKAITVDELSQYSTDFDATDDSLLKAFIERGKESNKTAFVIRYSECQKEKTLYMDHLSLCEKVYEETMAQTSKAEWYYLRYGRITASKLYETSRCKTSDGSLVASLMGGRSIKGNKATRRGQLLESAIFNVLKKKYPNLRNCGILLNGEMPIFGASPDAATDDTIFEIKCPLRDDTIANYIENGILKNKVYFQMQLQMLMSKKTKGILVVADPKFEENKKIMEFEVVFDEIKLKPLLSDCETFWKQTIFPQLK